MQIELILNDVVKYVQFDQYPIGHYELGIKAPEDRYGRKIVEGYMQVKERFRISAENSNVISLKWEYLDIFEGVKSDGTYTVQYDENRDIQTT